MHIVPNVLPRSLCSWPRTSLHLLEEGLNHLIVHFAYLCHVIGEENTVTLAELQSYSTDDDQPLELDTTSDDEKHDADMPAISI